MGVLTLSMAMLLTSVPWSAKEADAATDYVYDDSYTLGWFSSDDSVGDGKNGEISVYLKGDSVRKTVEEAGIPVYDKSGDNPFGSEIDQKWDAEKLILTRPVQYTTADGVVHNVESMLTGFDFIADPTAIDNSKVDGKLYVYGTTEGFSYSGGKMADNAYDNHSLTILSSSDMVNWTDEGFMDTQNLENDVSTWGDKVKCAWATKAWAPSGLAYDGDNDGQDEYYLFHTNSGAVGYVMSDTPTGPWRDPLKKTLFSGVSGVKWCFDPAVLRDDKGNAYCYFGGGCWSDGNEVNQHPDGIARPKTGRVSKLKFNENGEALADGSPLEMNTYYMFEDSEINQFNGKYYYSYCANFHVPSNRNDLLKSGSIACYVSSDPMDIAFDPYPDGEDADPDLTPNFGDGVYHHYLGMVLDNPSVIYGQSYNNHHHMQDFRGHHYILYHSTELNNALHRSSHQYRNLHVDEINVDKETDMITCTPSYEGAKQIGNYNLYKNIKIKEDGSEEITDDKTINATTTSYSAGVKSYRSDAMVDAVYNEDSKCGGSPMVLDAIDTGDWTKLQGVDFGKGIKKFEAVVASTTTEGAIELFKDDPTKASNMIGKIQIKDTGDIESYDTISTTEIDHNVTGVHDLYFVFRGSDYRVASWKFEESPVAPATATPEPTAVVTATLAPAATQAPVAPASPSPVQAAPEKTAVDTTKTYTVGKNKYKITDADAKTVDYAGPAKKNVKSVVIPGSVKIGGVSYKVTGIAAKAFKGCKKVTTITVKATGLKKVGAKAFAGIAAKAKIKVPKGKLKDYKKLFKGKGQGKKVKIK